jgi:hypothetical protein
MALRISTGLRDFMLERGSLKRALNGGKLKIYSGSQPTSPDDVPNGTLLLTVSLASGAITNEVLSQGSVTLNTGTTFTTFDSLTVDGINIMSAVVAWDTDLDTSLQAVVDNINDNVSTPDYIASYNAGSDKITITALPGTGTSPNTFVVASASTGGDATWTDVNMGSETAGVAAVNGLDFGDAASGQLVKGSAVWSGVAGATGTAGWFRFEGSVDDDDSSSTTLLRLDGNIGTTGADLNVSSTTITSGATTTIDSFNVTLPAS